MNFDIYRAKGACVEMAIPQVGTATLNMPAALKGEEVHGLPPHCQRPAFLVDDFERCPTGWMHSEVRDGVPFKSYFVPVKADRGLWIDLNGCYRNEDINHHVAALVSIQGINAITGQRLKDNNVALEQFVERCPVHDLPFGADRHCPQCGFMWPKQNYLCGTEHTGGDFWIDGFRAEDGTVRQFVFTEEEMRSVAKAVLGEDRCWALGIAFYHSRDPRPSLTAYRRKNNDLHNVFLGIYTKSTWGSANPHSTQLNDFSINVDWDSSQQFSCSVQSKEPVGIYTLCSDSGGPPTMPSLEECSDAQEGSSESPPTGRLSTVLCRSLPKRLEVAAGAKINQRFRDDPNALSFWQDKPSGVIVVTYCPEDMAEEILAGPRVDRTASGEGFLQNIPHGNP